MVDIGFLNIGRTSIALKWKDSRPGAHGALIDQGVLPPYDKAHVRATSRPPPSLPFMHHMTPHTASMLASSFDIFASPPRRMSRTGDVLGSVTNSTPRIKKLARQQQWQHHQQHQQQHQHQQQLHTRTTTTGAPIRHMVVRYTGMYRLGEGRSLLSESRVFFSF